MVGSSGAEAAACVARVLRAADVGVKTSAVVHVSGGNVHIRVVVGGQTLVFQRPLDEPLSETLKKVAKKMEATLLGPAPKKGVVLNEKGEKVIDKSPPKARLELSLGAAEEASNEEAWAAAAELVGREVDGEQTWSFPVLYGLPTVPAEAIECVPAQAVYASVPLSVVAHGGEDDDDAAMGEGATTALGTAWFVYDKPTANADAAAAAAAAAGGKKKKAKAGKDAGPSVGNADDLAKLGAEFRHWGEAYTPTSEDVGRYLLAAVVPGAAGVELLATTTAEAESEVRDRRVGLARYVDVSASPVAAFACLSEYSEKYPPTAAAGDIRVMTYNVLYDGATIVYKTGKSMYPYAKEEALEIGYRRQLQMHELLGFAPDIACLQEMQSSLHSRYFVPLLAERGYAGAHFPKLGDGMREGVSIFYNARRFEAVDVAGGTHRSFPLGGAGLVAALQAEEAGGGAETWRKQLLDYCARVPKVTEVIEKTGTVCQVSALRDTQTGQCVVVGNTHLWFHPRGSHIRVLQLFMLYKRMEDVAATLSAAGAGSAAFVVCGDLNTQLKSAPHTFSVTGELTADHAAWHAAPDFDFTRWDFDSGEVVAAEEASSPTPEDTTPGPRLTHGLALSDASPDFAYSNFTPGFTGRLDYVMHSDAFTTSYVHPLPDPAVLAKEGGGIPSSIFPSDHLPICADLSYV